MCILGLLCQLGNGTSLLPSSSSRQRLRRLCSKWKLPFFSPRGRHHPVRFLNAVPLCLPQSPVLLNHVVFRFWVEVEQFPCSSLPYLYSLLRCWTMCYHRDSWALS